MPEILVVQSGYTAEIRNAMKLHAPLSGAQVLGQRPQHQNSAHAIPSH